MNENIHFPASNLAVDSPPRVIHTKFGYLKRNLYHMAELVLEQTLSLCDSLENDNYEGTRDIILQDELLDQLEKENDNISQSAILDAVATRGKMGMDTYEPERLLKQDPLRFALFAIRITIYLEQLGDKLVAMAQAFVSQKLPVQIFRRHTLLNRSLSRMATAVGMAVECLVEEKERFYGSIREVSQELEQYCLELTRDFTENNNLNRAQLTGMSIIITKVNEISSLSVNVAEELVRLTTREDLRHSRSEDMPALLEKNSDRDKLRQTSRDKGLVSLE